MHHYISEEERPQFHHCESYSHTKYLSPLFTSKPLLFITKHNLNIHSSSAVVIHFTEHSHHILNSQWTLRSYYEHFKTHRGIQKHLLRVYTIVSMSVLMVICTPLYTSFLEEWIKVWSGESQIRDFRKCCSVTNILFVMFILQYVTSFVIRNVKNWITILFPRLTIILHLMWNSECTESSHRNASLV